MISPSWLALLLGFDLTALLVAYLDAAHCGVRDVLWLPGLLGALYFFLGVVPFVIGWVVVFDAVVTASVVLILKIGSKGIGQADIIALAIFGLWPLVLMPALTGAAFTVWAFNRSKGRRYIPAFKLVGWLGAFVIPVSLLVMFNEGALI